MWLIPLILPIQMPRRFPLFSLPNLALQHRVFRQFTLNILFELSLCSKKSEEAVRKWTKSLKKQRKGVMYIQAYDSYLDVRVTNSYDTCTWLISSTRFVDAWNCEERLKLRKLNGVEFNVGRAVDQEMNEFERIYGCIGDPLEKVLIALVDYLVDVLNCSVSRITLGVHSIEHLGNLLNWETLCESEAFSLCRGSVTPDEMKKVLDIANGKKNVFITSNCTPFEHCIPISARSFYGSDLNWFTGNHLMNLKCEHIVFCNPIFTHRDYKAFIEDWIEGNNPNLTVFRVQIDEEFGNDSKLMDDMNFDNILGDIPSYPGVPKRYDPVFKIPSSGERYAVGRDIFRKDGKMATLLLKNYPYLVDFVVWHRPHPDKWNEYRDFYNLFKV